MNVAKFLSEVLFWSHYNGFIHEDTEGVEYNARPATSNTWFMDNLMPKGVRRELFLWVKFLWILPEPSSHAELQQTWFQYREEHHANSPPLPVLTKAHLSEAERCDKVPKHVCSTNRSQRTSLIEFERPGEGSTSLKTSNQMFFFFKPKFSKWIKYTGKHNANKTKRHGNSFLRPIFNEFFHLWKQSSWSVFIVWAANWWEGPDNRRVPPRHIPDMPVRLSVTLKQSPLSQLGSLVWATKCPSHTWLQTRPTLALWKDPQANQHKRAIAVFSPSAAWDVHQGFQCSVQGKCSRDCFFNQKGSLELEKLRVWK